MSSVRKKDQSEHKFSVLDVVLEAYDHTTTVIANPNIFTPKWQSLTDRIDYEATMIYHYCRSANEDYDNRIREEAEIRLGLEEDAIQLCMRLKTDIKLSQRKFHFRAQKATAWNEKVKAALAAIKSWKASEERLYRENFGL